MSELEYIKFRQKRQPPIFWVSILISWIHMNALKSAVECFTKPIYVGRALLCVFLAFTSERLMGVEFIA